MVVTSLYAPTRSVRLPALLASVLLVATTTVVVVVAAQQHEEQQPRSSSASSSSSSSSSTGETAQQASSSSSSAAAAAVSGALAAPGAVAHTSTHLVFAGSGVETRDEEAINEIMRSAPIVCVCRCCYLGDCNTLRNASWFVSTCGDCTSSLCREHVSSAELRVQTARTFEALQDGVPEEARAGIEVDVCEVISVLEAATCTHHDCKRTTDVRAECFDRNAPVQKYAIIAFVILSAFAVVLGFTKNYIPALQEFNVKNFDY